MDILITHEDVNKMEGLLVKLVERLDKLVSRYSKFFSQVNIFFFPLLFQHYAVCNYITLIITPIINIFVT